MSYNCRSHHEPIVGGGYMCTACHDVGYEAGRRAALAEAERLCEEMENARTGEVLLDAGWASACAALAVRIRALREGTE